MFVFHPPFQIDGNFGGAAGIAEVLLQSHEDCIVPLPALPDAWSDGEYSGLCARDGFELSVSWKNGKVDRISVLSKCGALCKIKAELNTIKENGNDVEFEYCDGVITFKTVAGKVYNIS